MMLDVEKCWAVIESRDAAADGKFFYGVVTTGVYCRPGCPSRRPLRANTVFFETIAAAEAAGLRACKRCRPADPSAASRHIAAVEKACALLRTSETMPSLAELAGAAAISRYHFHRLFKQITGATPRDYARTHRLGALAQRLDAGEKVTQAIYASGFGSSSRAYEVASEALGMTPAVRRKGGEGETIRFVTVTTPLGWALVAATWRGVCLTALGDDRERLAAAVRERFPAAEVVAEDPGLRDWAERIVRFITAPSHTLDLPLDIRGTAFQARVWRALQKIPLGQTATYSEIALVLGQPRAVRAVARACAANDLALVVPCHRVIREDGDLAGYRWGIERKRALLARERAAANDDAA
ncbi:MAG: bifunctional DNA-binding transcriptional regulator/O6-methylguanine-DNA methyltransferase Ada [Alphaproteobacteria bacterium]|nr:bifunctional DNA-binding transcriptional regulator/O6-methylguanine-DNA methyltransferase Ada [Alphaproteobacteria bacterium]